MDAKLSRHFVRHEKKIGKGAAIRSGLSHVDTDLVVIHDADLEYHPADLLKMVEVFLVRRRGCGFLALASSPAATNALFFFRHELGNKAADIPVRPCL